MVLIGLVLLVLGLIFAVHVLFALGLALTVIGLILNLVPIGGSRRRYY